jgi:hypothetical protein
VKDARGIGKNGVGSLPFRVFRRNVRADDAGSSGIYNAAGDIRGYFLAPSRVRKTKEGEY